MHVRIYPNMCPCADGRAVEVDPHHIIIEDPDGSCTLILDNMTADDSGQYMCFATSAAGNASTLGKITVQGMNQHPECSLSFILLLITYGSR